MKGPKEPNLGVRSSLHRALDYTMANDPLWMRLNSLMPGRELTLEFGWRVIRECEGYSLYRRGTTLFYVDPRDAARAMRCAVADVHTRIRRA
jgi:hypothetical protein